MNRHARRRLSALGELDRPAHAMRNARKPALSRPISPRAGNGNRRTLLLGTALATTLLIGTVAAPASVHAQVTMDCTADPGSAIFDVINNAPIICINVLPRTGNAASGGAAVNLGTGGANETIFLDNDGNLVSNTPVGGDAFGIRTYTDNIGATITVINTGDITMDGVAADSVGLFAYVYSDGADSDIDIDNDGDIWVRTVGNGNSAQGIYAYTDDDGGAVTVTNRGDMVIDAASSSAQGIFAGSNDDNSPVTVTNFGDLTVTSRVRERCRCVWHIRLLGWGGPHQSPHRDQSRRPDGSRARYGIRHLRRRQ